MVREIKISSKINNFCKIENFLNDIFKDLNFSRKVYCKIYLSVSEGVNNAIIHGNKQNPEKYVHIVFKEIKKGYKVTIHDEGDGFDYENIPDPTLPENIVKESGRGIFIMKQYADDLIFLDNGRIVELQFKN